MRLVAKPEPDSLKSNQRLGECWFCDGLFFLTGIFCVSGRNRFGSLLRQKVPPCFVRENPADEDEVAN
jgi:hypothetical protein